MIFSRVNYSEGVDISLFLFQDIEEMKYRGKFGESYSRFAIDIIRKPQKTFLGPGSVLTSWFGS